MRYPLIERDPDQSNVPEGFTAYIMRWWGTDVYYGKADDFTYTHRPPLSGMLPRVWSFEGETFPAVTPGDTSRLFLPSERIISREALEHDVGPPPESWRENKPVLPARLDVFRQDATSPNTYRGTIPNLLVMTGTILGRYIEGEEKPVDAEFITSFDAHGKEKVWLSSDYSIRVSKEPEESVLCVAPGFEFPKQLLAKD